TGTPCASKRSRAWYSYRSMSLQSLLPRQFYLTRPPEQILSGRLRVRLHATELLKHNCSRRMEALLNHDSALTELKPFLAGHSAAVTVFQIRQTVLWPRLSALGLAPR